LVVQHRFPLLLRKLDPETSISTPVPTASFIAVRIIHIPGISIHMPGILIHILPEPLFTSPRNRYSHAPEYAIQRILRHSTVATTQNHIKIPSPDAIAAMKQFSEALLCSTCAPDGDIKTKGSVQ